MAITTGVRPGGLLTQYHPRGIWRTYDATDGLEAGVWCLRQTADGFLWLGTRSGLCRYDGCSFDTYAHAPGPLGREVTSLAELDGRLIVGCADGLAEVSGDRLGPLAAAGRPIGSVSAMDADSDGRLWLAGADGLTMLAGATSRQWELPGPADCLLAGHGAAAWVGGRFGLLRVDGGQQRLFTVRDGLSADHVMSLCVDRAGQLWVGTVAGVARFDGQRFENLLPAGDSSLVNIRAILQDGEGRLWLGSAGQGLFVLEGGELVRYGVRDGLIGEHVTSLAEDQEGHLWVGDGLSGVSRRLGETTRQIGDETVSEGLCRDRVGRLWFAAGNHLCCFDNGAIRRRRFRGRLFGVAIDGDQRIWVATWGEGLWRFDHPERVFDGEPQRFAEAAGVPSELVGGLAVGADGTVWAGTGHPGCLCRFTGRRFESVPTGQPTVARILPAGDGRVWAAGFSGGGLACLADGQVRVYTMADGLPSDAVQSLVEDDQGRIWAGTRHGLARLDGDRFSVFGRDDGLLTLDNQIACRAANGELWFGTRCGLYRADNERSQVLTRDDGLPGHTITALLPEPDGAMLVGTLHGLVRYRPTASEPPRITIEEVTAGRVFAAPEQIELTASEAALVTIAFRGVHVGTRRMRYRYRLVGHDAAWSGTWDRQVRYDHLAVGTYTFQVWAVNRDLVMSVAPAMVQIRVVEDPWREQKAEYEAELDRMQQALEVQERAAGQNRALMELTRSSALFRGDWVAAQRQVCQVMAEAMALDQVSVWRLQPDGHQLHCELAYLPGSGHQCPDHRLDIRDFPEFIAQLEENRSLSIDNIATDPLVRELAIAVGGSLPVGAWLDASVRTGGRLAAILVLEQFGRPRRWTVDEQQFASSAADVLALALETQERRLAEGRVRYQAQLLEQVSEAVVAVDEQQQITSWNQTAEALYGWRADEVLGRTLTEVIPVRLRGCRWQDAWASVQTAGTWRGEAVHDARNGKRIDVDWSLALLRDDDGAGLGAVAISRDISERVRAEEDRRRLELRMQHAQKLESLGVMAGGIAHDFNNLLMGILGHAGLALLAMPPATPARDSVVQIELAAQRAADLTRQMLAYAGKSHLEKRPLNLSKLVQEMLHLLEVSVSKKAQLECRLEPEVPAIEADATQVRQIVMNLITNASDALDDQAGVVRVRTGLVHADRELLASSYVADDLPAGDYVFVEVSDTGSGMDEVTRSRIFEPFFTTKFTGRGLGLAAVLGIVRGHHGAMMVSSELGCGTTFTVLLPTTSQVVTEPVTWPEAAHLNLGGGTVLVVDDEAGVRSVVQSTLEQYGFEALTAEDGLAGLEVFRHRANDIRLVILDLTMPRLDGIETFRELRKISDTVKVILSSGYTEQEVSGRFEPSELAGFLQKPYGPRQLLEVLKQVL